MQTIKYTRSIESKIISNQENNTDIYKYVNYYKCNRVDYPKLMQDLLVNDEHALLLGCRNAPAKK